MSVLSCYTLFNMKIEHKIIIALLSAILVLSVAILAVTIVNTNSVEQTANNESQELSPEAILEKEDTLQPALAKSSLHECSRASLTTACYTIEAGDSLWMIAERFLDSGRRWRELDTNPPYRKTYENPRKQLWVGAEVGIHGSSLLPDEYRQSGSYEVVEVVVSPYKDDVLLVVNDRADNSKFVVINGNEYDDGSVVTSDGYRVPHKYASITNIGFSENGESYFVGRSTSVRESQTLCDLFIDQVQYGFWCGDDVQDPVFSPNGQNFVFRTNGRHPDGHESDKSVHIFGSYAQIPADGWFYSADLDSIAWIDDNSYVYRRYDSEHWWIEINYMDKVSTHERIGPFDEVQILGIENGLVKYSVKQQDGTETVETYQKEQ